MNKKRIISIGAAVSLLLAGAAFAQPPTSTAPPSAPTRQTSMTDDQKFVFEGIQGDMSEVKVGKLAQQKGQSATVRDFGQMLERDHGDHLQKLQAVAKQLGVASPTEPTPEQKAMYAKLEMASSSNFDKQFAQAMIADHKKDIAKYQQQAKGSGPVAELAQQTVPVLQTHLQMAQKASGMKASASQHQDH